MRPWGLFLLQRLGLLVLVLFVVSLLTFTVTRLTGTPLFVAVGQRATQEMIEARAETLGLNRPLPQQYGTYMANLLQGNLGTSRRTFTPVRDDIAARLPATFELVVAAVAVGVLWAVPLGARAAARPRGWADRLGSGLAQLGVSVPGFWLGLLLIFLLYYVAQVFPAPLGRLGGAEPPPRVTGMYTVDALVAGEPLLALLALWHLALPAITLSFTSSPPIFNVTRNAVAAVLASPYVEAVRSYGIPEREVYRRHVARNAAPPVVNLVAMTFGYLIGGAVLIEVVFSWPGIGLYAVQAMDFSDYDAVLGVVLLSALIYVLVYFAADLLQYSIDPRLRR